MQIEGLSKLPEHALRTHIKKEFTEFIQNFRDADNEPKYKNAVRHALINSKHHIVFGFRDFISYNSDLASLIFH